jgi:predicted DNA-binding WGR domain protein
MFACMEPATQRDRFIWLEAIDRPRNIARRYAIALSQDLFGSSIVEYSWGRIGTRGQVSADKEAYISII